MTHPPARDMEGQVALVTGASSGIGLETARALFARGAHVVLACRDEGRGRTAQAAIAKGTAPDRLELALVDFSEQASVRRFARDVGERHPRLHVLVNNAGMWSPARRTSADGIELTWATNVLGYTLATDLLLEPLRRAQGRIVSVASRLAYGLDLEDVEFVRRRYNGVTAYAQSKQANRLWTWALARRLEGTGVTANAVHPGGVNTGIFRKGGGLSGRLAGLWARLRGLTPVQGAETVILLAASPDLAGKTGRFYAKRREVPCEHRDAELEERLFELCRRMTSRRA